MPRHCRLQSQTGYVGRSDLAEQNIPRRRTQGRLQPFFPLSAGRGRLFAQTEITARTAVNPVQRHFYRIFDGKSITAFFAQELFQQRSKSRAFAGTGRTRYQKQPRRTAERAKMAGHDRRKTEIFEIRHHPRHFAYAILYAVKGIGPLHPVIVAFVNNQITRLAFISFFHFRKKFLIIVKNHRPQPVRCLPAPDESLFLRRNVYVRKFFVINQCHSLRPDVKNPQKTICGNNP